MTEDAARRADRVDMVGAFRMLARNRWMVLAFALLAAVTGYVVGHFLIKSRADAFLQLSYTAAFTTPEDRFDRDAREPREPRPRSANDNREELRFRTSIADYKVLSAAVFSREGFIEYAAKAKKLEPELIERLDVDLAKDNLLVRWVRPVFAMARADLREIPDQLNNAEANFLVGTDITVERRVADEALAICKALGDYVRDSAILIRARDFATGVLYRTSSRLLELDRQIVLIRLQLAQAETRRNELAQIRDRYPEAARGDVRQVISVDKATSRFLPPVTQIVGIESQLAETREALRLAEWETERSRAMVAFLEPALKIVREARSGTEFFPLLDKLMATTFDDTRLKSDAWRDAYSTLEIELTTLKTLYFERMRFIAAPTLNQIPLWLRLAPAAIGFVLGALLAVAYLLIRERVSIAGGG